MDSEIRKRISELTSEKILIISYNPQWPKIFEDEKKYLKNILPPHLIKRIEHFGSTAVPGLSAKPIIDILVEVTSLTKTKKLIVPIMEKNGYEYFWRPAFGDFTPPFYAWFIKRNDDGLRTHHIHMVEADSEMWDRLYFRDYLMEFPEITQQYENLKRTLELKYPHDRVGYTKEKTNFIKSTTLKAKKYYKKKIRYFR